ncbi:MAG: DUF2694 domain-containing protein [Deltaproteobacteria bacterium]|nr:DUF2694 domain-containing protein [Deltaproteobacteria bacterium]
MLSSLPKKTPCQCSGKRHAQENTEAALQLVDAEKVAKDFFRKARRLPAALRARREQVAAGHSPRPVA